MKQFFQTKGAKTGYAVIGILIVFSVLFVVLKNSKFKTSLKAAEIVFIEEVHDFGHVQEGEELQYSFKFTNKGDSILNIKNVQTSCGCTGAQVGEKTKYKKNESGEIKIDFNTQGRSGLQEKTISVFSNDPKSPQKDLKIICQID